MSAEEKLLRAPFPSFSFRGEWEEQEEFKPEPLDFAERRAMEAESNANLAEADGEYKAAEAYRNIASVWRNNLSILNDAAASISGSTASESIDVLLAQATIGSEQALTVLLALVNQTLAGLHALASNGRTGAADVLLASITEATNAFGILAHRRPDVFLGRTRSAFGVPSIVSPFVEKTRDNAELIKVLRVGETFPFQLPTEASGRGKQMKFRTPANLWVFRLCAHIELAQGKVAKFQRLTPEEQRRLVAAHPASPAWIDDAAALQPLSAETCSQWLDVIWKIAMDATGGKPEEEPILFALQNLPAEHGSRYSDEVFKTTLAAYRKKIKEALERALRQLIAQREKAWRVGESAG